ncbi:oocyte zinc finger protein XlCOF6-like [Melitaea cinxia]|uniref:oocyte zinc finger protein XlCOF6-like n=1 Tax=Melitaea cinxia TaxID=113334 RepID=UPI001E274438|nr:oocyte zinc finger protein XlCOF6-like [Melitaea cinxia]
MTSQNNQNIESTDDLENSIPLTAIVDINQSKVRNKDIKYLCRACLMAEKNMVSLATMIEDESLADMFTSISSIKVNFDESLPFQICASCQQDVIHCYNFQLKCRKTDDILRSLRKKGFSNIHYIHNTREFDKADTRTQTIINDVLEAKQDLPNKVKDSVTNDNEIKIESNIKFEINAEHEDIEYLEDDFFYESNCDKGEDDQRRGVIKNIPFTLQTFLKSKTLKTHTKKCHIGKISKPYNCSQCKESFNSENDLHIHSALHVKGTNWMCNQCFKTFNERNRFRRHIRRHMESQRFACEVCSKTFAELSALRRHSRVHTGEKVEKKYQCAVCEKRFVDSSQLAAHSSRHTGVRPCACADCGKAFPSRRLLASHRLVHDDLKRFACAYCDKRFRHESTRNTHHRTHTGEKPYVCSICGKTFIQSSNLKLHMRTHTGERPYTCDICDRKFTSGSSLTSHRRTHTGEKPYSCHICGKRFARTDMRTHLRQHSGERPFACCVCAKTFVNAARLRDHHLTHTGETKYECAICNEKFKKKCYLAKHIKNHDKDKKNKEKNILIVQQVPIVMDNNIIYTNNTPNEIIVSSTGESNNDNNDNKDVTLVEEVPLEVSGELVLQDDSDVKAELVVVSVGQNDVNYQEQIHLNNTNHLNYDNQNINHNLVAINENNVNINDSESVVEESAVKLYQLDQSLVQIQTSGSHITIRKITSKMTTNF